MVDQLKTQPDIAKNIVKQQPEIVHAFWENLAETLNSLGPPFKEISEWKKVWSDFKSSIRKKLSVNKKTAGEESEEQFVTSLEEEVIQLVGLRNSVEVVPQTRSFGVPTKRKFEEPETISTESIPPISPLPNIEAEVFNNDNDVSQEQEDDSSRNLSEISTSKKKNTGQTKTQSQLLEDLIGIQKTLNDKVSVALIKNTKQTQNLNTKIEKIFVSLDRLGEHEARRNDILQSLLDETRRHNRRMEKLVVDKEQYLSDSMSE
ncbi:uncharacterized protein LOC129939063 isoform X2 [Eupeodes corollae]|nr:uncharacterized protein LOC129939063 isoform X2 [Eupeodes corollae]